MTKGIYCYIDKKNNKVVYVGRDSNIHIDKRHKQHSQPSTYDKQVFNRVLQNNPDRYTYQRLWEIEDCTNNHLNQMEIYFTDKYNPKFSYTKGGEGTSGYKWTDEQKKQKSGENHPNWGKPLPEEIKKKISKTKKGKKWTEEQKKKISGENSPNWGKKRPERSKRMKGENHPNWGKALPEKTKKKISKKLIGKKQSKKAKRKISKTLSEERNTTGFYRVCISNCPSCKKGFSWRYRYYVDSQRKSISSPDLNKLKEKVLEKKLEWYVINEENALKSLKKDEECVKK